MSNLLRYQTRLFPQLQTLNLQPYIGLCWNLNSIFRCVMCPEREQGTQRCGTPSNLGGIKSNTFLAMLKYFCDIVFSKEANPFQKVCFFMDFTICVICTNLC